MKYFLNLITLCDERYDFQKSMDQITLSMDNIVYSFHKIGITEPQEIADMCDLNMKATWGFGPSEINSIDNFTKNIYKRADNLKSCSIISIRRPSVLEASTETLSIPSMTTEAEVFPEPLTTLSPIIDNQARVGLKRNKRKNKRNKFKQKEASVF
ncbi:hypothetical protein BD770DRAFT_399717 [Pilaira anomala]|nr:hypothetical protein BD770DRAFT_399717 [Pilaira anomala]